VRAAVNSAAEGHGGTRLFSYQVAEHVQNGRLRIVLRANEHSSFPVHVITLEGRLSVPKVGAFGFRPAPLADAVCAARRR
jgi:hypothetical protein